VSKRFSIIEYVADLDDRDELWIVAARQYWRPVYRKRTSVFKTMRVKDRHGEDIWIAGEEEMSKSELQWRVQDMVHRNIPPTWGIITEDQKTLLINLEIN